jgi:hypothetical protein
MHAAGLTGRADAAGSQGLMCRPRGAWPAYPASGGSPQQCSMLYPACAGYVAQAAQPIHSGPAPILALHLQSKSCATSATDGRPGPPEESEWTRGARAGWRCSGSGCTSPDDCRPARRPRPGASGAWSRVTRGGGAGVRRVPARGLERSPLNTLRCTLRCPARAGLRRACGYPALEETAVRDTVGGLSRPLPCDEHGGSSRTPVSHG